MGLSKEAKRLEKLAAAAEVQKKLKREELEREMRVQGEQKVALDQTWREIVLKIKEPVFKQDIEIMWNTFDRAFDKKNHLINSTLKLINIAVDQYQRIISSFCFTIDTMTNKFLTDLNELSKNNDIITTDLLKSGETDAMRIMMDHTTAETHLQLMIYSGDITADSLVWTKRGEYFVKEDEQRVKYMTIREYLRSSLEDKYNSVWNEYKALLKAYVLETAHNQKQVRKLRQKENLMMDIIACQGKRLASSDGMLKRLRTELATYESGTKQAVFRDRRNRYRAACNKLKKRLSNGCAIDLKQLSMLIEASDDTLAWLEAAAKKGEKILRMAALCRKFESLPEKILPYSLNMPHSPTYAKDNNRQKSYDQFVTNAIKSTSGLTKLWQRISNAELTRTALYREKMLLIQENQNLILKLQESKNKKIGQPETRHCICTQSNNRGAVGRPVAIEGCLELSKYR